jgi:hypothetical protein
LIAPLAISEARQLKNENTSRCAVREFFYHPRKSEFGDSLVKVLFWKEQSPPKKTAIRLSPFRFFSWAARLPSDRLIAPLHKAARTSLPARAVP